MPAWGYLFVGVALGVGVVVVLNAGSEGACCKRVSAAVRDKVSTAFGEGIASFGDTIGLYSAAPTLLDVFGVK
jgi:hypothetical protein